jgi:hypothetical protein
MWEFRESQMTISWLCQDLLGQRVLMGDQCANAASPQVKTFRGANLLYGKDFGVTSPYRFVDHSDVVYGLNHLGIGFLPLVCVGCNWCL